jgi:hypothetical protein
MGLFLNIILYIIIGYLAVWSTLFLHEFSHAFWGWLFGVCQSPVSIGYLPVIKLPMTPLIDEKKVKKLASYKQLLIHAGGLLMNLLMFILVSLIVLKNPTFFSSYIRSFILLIIVSNFAELESYITFGAIKPISDVKFILQVANKNNSMIYIPGIILLLVGVYFLQTYIFKENEVGYLVFLAIFYVTACSSRIILTRPSSKI